jgi:parallel beta-helix repeat protein
MVRGGLYNEGEIWIRKDLGMGGQDGEFVTVMAYPGETPELTGERRMIVETNYIRIQGLTFLDTYSLDLPWWGDPDTREHVEILDNHFKGAFGIPLEFCGNFGRVEGNIIENADGESHAIYLHYGHDNIIRNNQIHGTYKYGIHVYDEHKAEDPPGFVRTYSKVLIEGNLIMSSQTRAGIILGTSADAPVPGVRMDGITLRRNVIINNASVGILVKAWAGEIKNVDIINNTLYNNEYGGIRLENCQNIRVHNNILVSTRGDHIGRDAMTQNLTVDHNLYWPAPIRLDNIDPGEHLIADPEFISAADTNFRLKDTSPAIDWGVDMGLPYSGSAPDLGAFEYGIPVSVKDVTLKAAVDNDSVILTWMLNTTKPVAGIDIEKSKNGSPFIRIEQIPVSDTIHSRQFTYRDPLEDNEERSYRIRIRFMDGSDIYSEPTSVTGLQPQSCQLFPNFPNPFNPSTTIEYWLEKSSHVKLEILNVLGRSIRTLVDSRQSTGLNTVVWDATDRIGRDVPSGVYFYRLITGSFRATRKMILMR